MSIPTTDNPIVLAHIKAQQYDEVRSQFPCGCFYGKGAMILLCAWHDGYDEGLAVADDRTHDEIVIDAVRDQAIIGTKGDGYHGPAAEQEPT